jgi:UDP:flavonoid glycosyltransferase YjiC (YdhE family)
MNFIFRIIQESTSEVYELCKGKDFIIVSHSQMGAVEADVLGLPTVNVTLQTQMIGENLKPKTLKDKIIGGMIARMVARPYNRIRKVYGLKSVKSLDEIMSDRLNLIPISKYAVERNPYWEEKNILTGYWYNDETDYTPDKELAEFISGGEKPVILALGAMSFEKDSEKEKLDMFVNAFKKTGCRAIIQGFQKTMLDYELPESMIACKSVPHSWLFKQAKFVIHHCGFGTTAATLIYGIPSIPVPHVLDQMGFAMQLNNLNAATKPLNARDLSEENIIARINEMNGGYEQMKKNAQTLSEKIKTEGGVSEAVRLIGELF